MHGPFGVGAAREVGNALKMHWPVATTSTGRDDDYYYLGSKPFCFLTTDMHPHRVIDFHSSHFFFFLPIFL